MYNLFVCILRKRKNKIIFRYLPVMFFQQYTLSKNKVFTSTVCPD